MLYTEQSVQMKISGKRNVMKLFSTHPDLDERIARLEQR
ncbi:heat shock protein HtpX [Jeotgalibacillus alimentarius]|uniref:Heat shock protein HtpX n=1 Tax=Jeotgalibacillus alimentarius TaxID=135826 RepID=A0A0C2W6P1_9BACL|nr:heat shock protein HtpX [Jeotgalibacillus alimentarius]